MTNLTPEELRRAAANKVVLRKMLDNLAELVEVLEQDYADPANDEAAFLGKSFIILTAAVCVSLTTTTRPLQACADKESNLLPSTQTDRPN